MPRPLGAASALFGWLFLLAGIVYIVMGTFETLSGIPGSIPRVVIGLVAIVVGSSVIRWAKRSGSG
jgi:xanthine/uracil permease